MQIPTEIDSHSNKQNKQHKSRLKSAIQLNNHYNDSFLLEIIKPGFEAPIDKKTKSEVVSIFEKNLKILHPFMPFLSEELWHLINIRKKDEALVISNWPNAEEYSDDLEQSYLHFSNYKDWLGNFLFNTFKIGFEMVKDGGYCLVNISDISIKNKHFELELDTINALEEIGWKYEFQIGMKMTRFIGLSTENIVNRVYDENKETYMKVEPVLVFKKE